MSLKYEPSSEQMLLYTMHSETLMRSPIEEVKQRSAETQRLHAASEKGHLDPGEVRSNPGEYSS